VTRDEDGVQPAAVAHDTDALDLVRRYLVTGAIDGGRRRDYQHSAIVTAMSQLKRWGAGADLFGDQAEWKLARDAVTALMERYHRR